MRPLLVAAALVAGLLMPVPVHAAALVLDGVTVRLPVGSTQVITVNRTHGYHARVTLWQRDGSGWTRVARTTGGRIGYGGLVPATKRRQSSGTTPLGTFSLPSSFGRHHKAARWRLPYQRIKPGDYWVQDNASKAYNRYRNKARGGFRWWLPAGNPNASERLADYPRQYEYAVVTGFNHEQVRHRGSGIFLHVNGPAATAGCVSAPRRFMKRTLGVLDPARRPVIAIGR